MEQSHDETISNQDDAPILDTMDLQLSPRTITKIHSGQIINEPIVQIVSISIVKEHQYQPYTIILYST